MIRPERRTRGDLTAVVVIVVVLLVGSGVLWWNSDARATVSQPAPEAVPFPQPPEAVPSTLREAWRAPSPTTPEPVVAGPVAVTARGGEVVGRDPATGEVRWRFARDIPLCTVGSEWGRAIAVYRKSHNCSEVTSLRGSTGELGPQRNSSAPFGTRLLSDGDRITATGRQTFETWRSDLVRTQRYGLPTDIKNPDNNLKRPECDYSSLAVGEGRVGVIEECPNAPGDRITVLKASPEDDEQPEEVFSSLLGSSRAAVVAVTKNRVAVVLRDRSEMVVYDSDGTRRSSHPVRLPAPSPPEANVRVESTTLADKVYWHTGTDTVALDPRTLSPLWTVPDTLGSGTVFAGELLVPVRGGLAVHDPNTGARLRVTPVERGDHRGPVRLDSVGGVLLEQRGDTVVALR